MGIEFRSNGRKVDLADWMTGQAQRAVDETLDNLEREIKRVRCRLHGRGVSVRRRKTSSGYTFDVESCCQEAVDRAKRVAH